ncbi:glycoside hydrolase family 1 protein, partial [Mesorhizobium sp. M7A.F.Ca.CA.001.09.1.1]
PRAVGRAFKALVANWNKLLATQSVCLALPVFLPSQQNDAIVRAQQEYARSLLSVDRVAEGGSEPFALPRIEAEPDAPG